MPVKDDTPHAKVLHVLVVTQYFWPENFRINDLVEGLVARGHRVTVLTGLPNYPEGAFRPGYSFWGPHDESFAGARVRRVPLVPRGSGSGLRLALNYLSMVVSGCLLGPWRVQGPVDVILVYEPSPVTIGIPAALLRWLKRKRIVFWVQDLWPESLAATGAIRSNVILRCVERLTRWIYARCDTILVPSLAFAGPIRGLGVPEDRIAYLPNSAELFYRPVARESCNAEDALMPRGFRVLFAGNIGAAQDFPTILRAAELTRTEPEIKWILLGDGRHRVWVEEEIARRGLGATVHLLGSRAGPEVPAFFAVADVLLVTLRRDPIFALTIPSKIQSYLACAKPIVSALDGEGARVVKESGAGFDCPAEDPERLAAAVLRMKALSSEERAQMGESARRYFDTNFNREMLLDRLESILATNAESARR